MAHYKKITYGAMITNIRKTDDPFERYKMCQPIITHIKNQTIIMNIKQLLHDLKLPENIFLKDMKKILCTNCKMKNNKLHISGNITDDSIDTTIRKIIDHRVLCPVCDLPELKYNQIITCQACGYSNKI